MHTNTHTQLSPTTSLTITYCDSDNLIAWDLTSLSYFGALALILLFISLQNQRVPHHFSEEGNQSSISVLITLAVFIPLLMFSPGLSAQPTLYLHRFWFTTIVSVVLPDVLLATLFLKKVYTRTCILCCRGNDSFYMSYCPSSQGWASRCLRHLCGFVKCFLSGFDDFGLLGHVWVAGLSFYTTLRTSFIS